MTDYTMPKLAMAMNEGTVSEWLVQDGSYVNKGDPLATVETEKVAYDVESPNEGYFYARIPVGETVPCDTVIGCFLPEPLKALAPTSQQAAAALTAAAVATASEPAPDSVAPPLACEAVTSRIKASPLARKLAQAAGLDLSLLVGTGPGGRIVKRDVLAADITPPLSAPHQTTTSEHVLARIPITGMRGTIGSRMVHSLQSTAQLTSNWESDISELLRIRETYIAREEALGTRVSVNVFLIKALTYAIRRVPISNACVVDDQIEIYEPIHMGIAISMPSQSRYDSGLIVGVLKHVERLGLVELDIAMRALIARVREGSATAEDLSGSTFTLSSTAGIGPPGLMSTPILNTPNVALLGPSTPIVRPKRVGGEWCESTYLPLSFTFDHRAMDGEPAARFMAALHDALENPELLMA